MSLFAWATGAEPSPKAVFQSSTDSGIPRLYSERHVPVADHRYWVQFTTVFESEQDVANMLTVADLRRAAVEAPENLVNLVEVLVMHLESLVDDPEFAPIPKRSPGGFAALFAPTSAVPKRTGRDRTLEVLNCCRVISRVIPVVYETLPARDEPSLEQLVLWMPRTRTKQRSVEQKERSDHKGLGGSEMREDQFTLTDGDESILSTSPAVQSQGLPDDSVDDRSIRSEVQVTVGHSLLDTLIELLFHAGFTMPWTDEQLSTGAMEISRVHFTIWEAGIGCPVDLEGTQIEHVLHRIEIMRCLLVLLAKPIYVKAADQHATTSIALEHIACELERPAVLAFLCSMLNTFVNYRQADGWFPEAIVGGTPERDAQASMCAQLLGVLLTYSSADNLFSFYLAKLYRESDLAFLADGFGKIFAMCMARTRGAFQVSTVGTRTFALPIEEHISEILPVLWVLLRENLQFRKYIVTNRTQSLRVASWLLFVALTNKTERTGQGQVRLAVLLLQDITAERDFSVQLSTSGSAATLGLPARLSRVHSTLAIDVLIEGVYSLLASGEYLAGLHVPLVTTLANTSPFWRNVSVWSAARLEQLLLRCSSPSYLLADEGNPRVLCILLESFNRVLQYQYTENAHVVYILVRSHRVFERLRKFDLDEALTSLRHMRGLSNGANTNAVATSGTSNESPENVPATPTASAPDNSGALPGVSESTEFASGQTENDITDASEEDKSGSKDISAETLQADPLTEAAKEGGTVAESEPAITSSESTEAEVATPVAIGRSGFVPTREWVAIWRTSLPLAELDAALSELLPPIEHLCDDDNVAHSAHADECVLAFLREQTLVGILPPPRPLGASPLTELAPVPWNQQGDVWIQSYVWGIVYLVGMHPLYDRTNQRHMG